MNPFYPKFPLKVLPVMLGMAVFGAGVAGVYGILHDQITYSISSEYFTKFKFAQFSYADPHRGPRAFVAVIGFLATWWVGMIVGWAMVRCAIRKDGSHPGFRALAPRFLLVMGVALASGVVGYLFGLYRTSSGVVEGWEEWQETFDVVDIVAFARVGYIHNFGYLGALLGLVIGLISVHRLKRRMD